MMQMEKPQTPLVLDIQGLTSHYGRIQALHGIDLQVRQGQLVALVGANGAGKTTLLRAISGVQPISAGSIAFAGQDVSRMSADKRVRAGICQVPEGRQVFGPMTVEDNLRLGAFTRPRAGRGGRHGAHVRPVPDSEGKALAAGRDAYPADSSRCWPWRAR